MTTIRRAAAVAACAASVVAFSGAVAASSRGAAPRPVVTAFQTEDSPAARIDASRAALTTVGVDGVLVAASGAGVGAPGHAAAVQRDRAHHDHLLAELLVSNYSDAVGDFSEPVAYRLLSSAPHRRAVAAALVTQVRRHYWDGIDVDLEALVPRDRAGLTAFVRTLRAALPHGAGLSIAVSNSTRASDYAANGYDLGALARAVDRVQLMAYDQHGPWEDVPGPVGALAWQRAGVVAALKFVPRARLDLGVAGYGYAWRPHSDDTLSVAGARRLAGSRARFDTRSGEWTATLADGSTLWWDDARSYRLRVTLARQLGLHGLAVWDLALADPLTG